MTGLAALIALRDAVVVGEFDPARLDGVPGIWRFNAFMDLAEPAFESIPELLRTRQNCPISWKAYKGSIDAAIALLEAILPGAPFWVETSFWVETKTDGIHHAGVFVPNLERTFQAEAPNLGRALLIATLNALIAETGQ